ncbi:MAG: DUF2294 domain-containing protein [Pirellulales bacterium]
MSLATSQRDSYRHGEPVANEHRDARGLAAKTKGEIEAAICESITHFQQEYLGHGPRSIRAYLLDELLVVRLQCVLTTAEQHLAKSLPDEKGRTLVKQVRNHLIEAARPTLDAIVQWVTGVPVLSLHHDISTVTGEEIILFTLAELPYCRPAKKRQSHDTACES